MRLRGAADARKHQIPRAKTRKTRVRGGKTSKNARRRALCATRRKKKGAFRISAKDQLDLFEQNEEYRDFVEKFKPKKTTDDCYTPQPVFDAVADWVANEYGFDRTQFVRPFWPDGDYERADYPDSCVVVDNPPFSILSEIVRFFEAENIRFFLFAPALTLFSIARGCCTYYPCGVSVTYANGAVVPTSFVSNLDAMRIRCCPQLFQAVKAANDVGRVSQSLPSFVYPSEIITAALAQKWTSYGVALNIPKKDSCFVRGLDVQRKHGKNIFGGGFLLSSLAAAERAAAERAASERAAAERAAAERAAAERAAENTNVWSLSVREREIQRFLDQKAFSGKEETDFGREKEGLAEKHGVF